MLRGIIVFAFVLVGCNAAAPGQGVYCGDPPKAIFKCLNSPRLLFYTDFPHKCMKDSECDQMTCIFSESGWMKDNKVDKKKVSAYFDTFAAENPAWSAAVTHLKAACLGDHDVPAQGVFINCPAYDVTHCVITSFVRNATPGQWQSTAECQYPREYAAACPVCPSACFAPQVPIGACSACQQLPRST